MYLLYRKKQSASLDEMRLVTLAMTTPHPTPADPALPEDARALRALMLCLSQVHRRQLAATLAVAGLTMAQYSVLVELRRAELHPAAPESCTMSSLAEATHQVAATMTGIVDRLAERGLVERQPDPSDRRAWRVVLQPAGRAVLDQVEARGQANTSRMLGQFSAGDRAALLRLMEQMLTAMQTQAELE